MLGASQEWEAGNCPWSHPMQIAQTLIMMMVVVMVTTVPPSICLEQHFSTLAAH